MSAPDQVFQTANNELPAKGTEPTVASTAMNTGQYSSPKVGQSDGRHPSAVGENAHVIARAERKEVDKRPAPQNARDLALLSVAKGTPDNTYSFEKQGNNA